MTTPLLISLSTCDVYLRRSTTNKSRHRRLLRMPSHNMRTLLPFNHSASTFHCHRRTTTASTSTTYPTIYQHNHHHVTKNNNTRQNHTISSCLHGSKRPQGHCIYNGVSESHYSLQLCKDDGNGHHEIHTTYENPLDIPPPTVSSTKIRQAANLQQCILAAARLFVIWLSMYMLLLLFSCLFAFLLLYTKNVRKLSHCMHGWRERASVGWYRLEEDIGYAFGKVILFWGFYEQERRDKKSSNIRICLYYHWERGVWWV
jgi:hypothetical protein